MKARRSFLHTRLRCPGNTAASPSTPAEKPPSPPTTRTGADAWPNTYSAPPSPSKKSLGIPTPKRSSAVPDTVGTPNATSKFSKPPTFSLRPFSTSRRKASNALPRLVAFITGGAELCINKVKPSATMASTPTNPNKSRGLARLIAALVPASPEPSSPNFKSSISNLESEVLLSLPQPTEPPFDIEKRRGIGDVLDAGESNEERQTACRQPEGQAKRSQPGARRESPPGGAGE